MKAGRNKIEKNQAATTPMATMLPRCRYGGASLKFRLRKPMAVVRLVRKIGPKFILNDSMIGGSLFVTRPAIMHYMAKRADMVAGAAELFDVIERGAVEISVNHVHPLSEAAEAHRAIEERRTTGSTILLPFA